MFVLFTDTDTDMTPERAKKYGYHLISMPYSIDEKEVRPYEDFEVFDAKPFYDSLRAGVLPKTSSVSPAAYVEYFEPFFKAGQDVLYVHFSVALSGTFSAMRIAEEELKKKYPDRKLYTIDTKAVTVGSLSVLYEIGELYLQGKSVEEIMEWAKSEVDKFAIYLFAKDLTFFRRSGRVKAFPAMMGNLLGIMPIITIGSDGVMRSIDKGHGEKKTLAKILEYVENTQENIKDHKVLIAHTDAEQTARAMGEMLKKKYGEDLDVEYVMVNPTAGSHCGPDSIGVSFHAKHRWECKK